MEGTFALKTKQDPLTIRKLQNSFDEIWRGRARMLKETAKQIVVGNYRIIEDNLLPNGTLVSLVASDLFKEVQKIKNETNA